MAKGGGLVVFDEDRLRAEGGSEVAELGAGELEEFRRRGRAAPALEQGECGEECGGGRRGEIEVHLQRDRVAGRGGGEVGRKVEAEHREGRKGLLRRLHCGQRQNGVARE